MRISDWSSDVCSSDLADQLVGERLHHLVIGIIVVARCRTDGRNRGAGRRRTVRRGPDFTRFRIDGALGVAHRVVGSRLILGPDIAAFNPERAIDLDRRSEETTSELQSLMRNSYA